MGQRELNNDTCVYVTIASVTSYSCDVWVWGKRGQTHAGKHIPTSDPTPCVSVGQTKTTFDCSGFNSEFSPSTSAWLQVTSADESTHVGMISKQWSGLAKEIFTDADNFGVTFPLDMDVKTKATMLGAVFLIVSVSHTCQPIRFTSVK